MTDVTLRQSVEVALAAGACLGRSSYAGEDLSGANLPNIDFRNSDLARIDLSGAVLTGACFRQAVMSSARLADADLRQAGLREARLDGADLRRADLRGANLLDADLTGADLADALIDGVEVSAATLKTANLAGARFDGLCLVGRDPLMTLTGAADGADVSFYATERGCRLSIGSWRGGADELDASPVAGQPIVDVLKTLAQLHHLKAMTDL